MLADALEEVGIARGDYIVRVNNRKVLNGVMEVAGVLDPSDPEKFAHERGIVLRAIDKIDRLGSEACSRSAWRRPQGRERRFHQGRGTADRADQDAIDGAVICQERASNDTGAQ